MPAPALANAICTLVTSNSAILRGEVTNDGGDTITARGFVFAPSDTNADPKMGGTEVTNLATAGAVGVFANNATGLLANRQYSFAGYASNAGGTTYTPVATFTTTDPPPRAATPRTDGDHFLLRMVRSVATLPVLSCVVLFSLILVVGFFVYANPATGDPVNYARGLITVLFATGTMAIAFILTVSALLSDSSDFERRFDKGKEILTIMIGIFGTILGFYFGTATSLSSPESIKLALSGPTAAIAVKIKGDSVSTKLGLKLISGKNTGTVKLNVEKLPTGVKADLIPDSVRVGEVSEIELKLTAAEGAAEGPTILHVVGVHENGSVSPVDVKINVAK